MPANRKRKPTPQNIDPHVLIARLSQESQQLLAREIIAPLLPGGRIRTRVGGLIYEFKLRGRFVGWGRFRPLNEREAEVLGEAQPWERGAYLELFPALRVILLWPDTGGRVPGTWLALPYNESDARQRFGFGVELLPVFLCDPTGGAERFERVIARVDGRTLWFEGPDALADPVHAEWLRDASARESGEDLLPGLAASERQALLYWRIHQLEQSLPSAARLAEQIPHQSHREQRAWLSQQARRLGLEESLRHALAKADAALHSFSEDLAPDGSLRQLIVEWSEASQIRRYRSAIDPHLTVVSSGICLSGRDRDFDLTSLVNVMTRSGQRDYDNDEY
ncbi:MAG TPA: hypothetical protein VKV19_10790 [Ktedonobacteraceae bacterium]|nr:hypothetical protein [Ktedonobacteraceae bacterium]